MDYGLVDLVRDVDVLSLVTFSVWMQRLSFVLQTIVRAVSDQILITFKRVSFGAEIVNSVRTSGCDNGRIHAQCLRLLERQLHVVLDFGLVMDDGLRAHVHGLVCYFARVRLWLDETCKVFQDKRVFEDARVILRPLVNILLLDLTLNIVTLSLRQLLLSRCPNTVIVNFRICIQNHSFVQRLLDLASL